jgi:hypothetical protein
MFGKFKRANSCWKFKEGYFNIRHILNFNLPKVVWLCFVRADHPEEVVHGKVRFRDNGQHSKTADYFAKQRSWKRL